MSVVPIAITNCPNCGSEITPAKICSNCKLPPVTQECKVCKKRIAIGAKFCSECKSYQKRWLRYVPMSLVPLSMLTALIAVISPAITAAFWALHYQSHTSVAWISDNLGQKTVTVYVWNTGRNPSVVLRAKLHYTDDKKQDASLEIIKPATALIKPNGQSIIELKVPDPDEKPSDKTNPLVILEIQESNDDTKSPSTPLSAQFAKDFRTQYKVLHPEKP